MAISKNLQKDVLEKNVRHIRDDLITIVHEDRSFQTGKFEEALSYIKEHGIEGLYEPFDHEDFKSRNEWNEDYWRYMVNSLLDNFCMERIEHLKDVGRTLFPAQTRQVKATVGEKSYGPSSVARTTVRRGSVSTGDPSKKVLPIAIGWAALLAGTVAIGITKTWMVAAAAVGVAAGAGIYCLTKKRR